MVCVFNVIKKYNKIRRGYCMGAVCSTNCKCHAVENNERRIWVSDITIYTLFNCTYTSGEATGGTAGSISPWAYFNWTNYKLKNIPPTIHSVLYTLHTYYTHNT